MDPGTNEKPTSGTTYSTGSGYFPAWTNFWLLGKTGSDRNYLSLAVLDLIYMDIDIHVLSCSVCFCNFLHNMYIDTASYLN